MGYTIKLDAERLAEGTAPFKITDNNTGISCYADSRDAASVIVKHFEKNGLDIFTQLWQEYIPTLQKDVRKYFRGTAFDKFRLVYKRGNDRGELYRGSIQIGEVWVDWGEPCLKHKIYG